MSSLIWYVVFHAILLLSECYLWPQLCLVVPESRASGPGRVRKALSQVLSTEEGSGCCCINSQASESIPASNSTCCSLLPEDTWSLWFPTSIFEGSSPAKWTGLLLGFSHSYLTFQLSLVHQGRYYLYKNLLLLPVFLFVLPLFYAFKNPLYCNFEQYRNRMNEWVQFAIFNWKHLFSKMLLTDSSTN